MCVCMYPQGKKDYAFAAPTRDIGGNGDSFETHLCITPWAIVVFK